MAVSRGGVAFWVGCVRSQGGRQPIKKQHWILHQLVDWQCVSQTRPLSSASWALAPPNSLRYQNIKQPVLSHPFHHASRPQRGHHDDEWEESLSVCVLVRQGESDGLHTLVEIPLFGHSKVVDLAAEAHKSPELSFPLTTVDGRREDDISVGTEAASCHRTSGDAVKTEHGCFRSLFEAEKCPAPFMYGSQFYCFHCPGTEPFLKPRRVIGPELPPPPPAALWSHAERAEGGPAEGDSEEEQKLALVYERLRRELPSFFKKNHDYSMYALDLEFINGLINAKTRGRVVYQLTVTLWRFLCLLYYTEAHLEVLKLTKHAEDGTVKARWRVRGIPFHTLMLRFYLKDKSQLYRTFDAFSTFYIGQDGLIHCHKVEKVMPARPPVLPRVTSLVAGALVALGLQEHRPALNLLPLLLSSLRQSRS